MADLSKLSAREQLAAYFYVQFSIGAAHNKYVSAGEAVEIVEKISVGAVLAADTLLATLSESQ